MAVSLDVSHKPGGRLPLLFARPTVTLATLKRAATSFGNPVHAPHGLAIAIKVARDGVVITVVYIYLRLLVCWAGYFLC